MSTRVLVTGSSGFVGPHVLKSLSRMPGVAVLGLDRRPPTRGVEALRADLRVLDSTASAAIREATHIVHLAAEAYVPLSLEEPSRYVDNNVAATVSLLRELAKSTHLERFLLVSTCEVYGTRTTPADEDSATDPASPYAASKLSQEIFSQAARHHQRLPLTVARLFNNFGPRQQENRLIPSVIRAIRTGSTLSITSGGRQTRDWVDVRDTADALTRLCFALPPRSGETYNVCSGREVSVEDVVGIFSEAAGMFPNVDETAGIPGYLRRCPGSSAKLQEFLGWSPSRSLEDFALETFSTKECP